VADASFDFIFSSSVLEHVRDRERAMGELRRCLRPDGVMVHLMPSPTWKLLQLFFYYPHLALSGLEYIGAERQLPAASTAAPIAALPAAPTVAPTAALPAASTAASPPASTERWRDTGPKPSWWVELKRGILPQVHGEYDGHFRELLGFRANAWADAFRQAGFDVRGQVRLPLYSGYGFGLERLRRAGERFGLSAHNAFIVTHPGAKTEWFWPCEEQA
jgi:SAM-dependent methyltransferase